MDGVSKVEKTLHNMIGDTARARFPYFIDVHHFTLVTRDMRFTFWLWDCLKHFENTLKQATVYETIWASRYIMPVVPNLLKALIARWSPRTNTILSCYGELGISL